MPVLTGYAYSAFNVLSGPSDLSAAGSTFRLDPFFDGATDALTFDFTDDDAFIGGDQSVNEGGDDSTQDVVVTDSLGNTVASGQVYLEGSRTLTAPDGSTITIYEVEIGGTKVGWLAQPELQPGVTYEVDESLNVNDTNAPAYSSFTDPVDYDPDADNTIQGGNLADSIYGEAGSDSIDGGAGDDTLSGRDGDDTISGGTGDDLVYGGAGDDLFLHSAGDGNDTIFGGSAGTNHDTLDLDGANGAAVILTGNKEGTVTHNVTGDLVNFREIEEIRGTEGGDNIDASADSSGMTLRGEDGADTISGGAGDDVIEGGTGADQLTGGGGNDTFVYSPGDGADTITDFNTGNSGALGDGDTTNNDFIDLSAYYDSIFELRRDFEDDGVLNQSTADDFSNNTQFAPGDGLTFQGASKSSFQSDNTGVVCFASGTEILTLRGEVPVERLRVGDLVVTRDNGPQALAWVSARWFGPDDLEAAPHLRPVEIAAGAFGNDRALVVSPQHGVLLRLDGEDILTRAIHLARLPGGMVRQRVGCRRIAYFHLFFESHQIVVSNGIHSESFFPGPYALDSLTQAARRHMSRLMPGLNHINDLPSTHRIYGVPARQYSRFGALPDNLCAFAAVA